MRKERVCLIIVSFLILALSSVTVARQIETAPKKMDIRAAPAIWVTRPQADVTWYAGSGNRYPVMWKTSGTFTSANVHIYLCDETGNRVIVQLSANTPNDRNENVEPPWNQPEGRYTIRVETTDGAVKGTSEPFFIRTSPFILTVPAGDLVRGRTYTIGWRTTKPSSLRISHILLRREGAMVGEWVLARDVPNSGRADVVIPSSVTPGTYRIEIQPGGSFGGMSFFSPPVRIID